MPSEKTAQALFAWFLNNAERQERFAAGANLFCFDEGICRGAGLCGVGMEQVYGIIDKWDFSLIQNRR